MVCHVGNGFPAHLVQLPINLYKKTELKAVNGHCSLKEKPESMSSFSMTHLELSCSDKGLFRQRGMELWKVG